MKRESHGKRHNVFMRAVKEGSVPFGYYGQDRDAPFRPQRVSIWCIWTSAAKLTVTLLKPARL
jgi:hypothetical protein